MKLSNLLPSLLLPTCALFAAGSTIQAQDFGRSTVTGDFNGDFYDDLAISSPDYSKHEITIVDGSPNGLGSKKTIRIILAHMLRLNSISWNDPDEESRMGVSLAAGDINYDGYDDLVIGAPGHEDDQGLIVILHGTPDGLTTYYSSAAPSLVLNQDQSNSAMAEAGDEFGFSLAVGRVNSDPYADIVVGAPGENSDGGVVHVFHGASYGITLGSNRTYSQNSSGVPGRRESGDRFGAAVAIGHFNGDWALPSIAVGVPGESFEYSPTISKAGAVAILAPDGRHYDLHQGMSGMGSRLEYLDGFGTSLAAGDFDGDRRDDLAIGVPGENIELSSGIAYNAGIVQVVYSRFRGFRRKLDPTDTDVWRQSLLAGGIEGYDYFGDSLAAGDFDRNGADDLAIGVPCEDWGSLWDAGVVNVVYGVVGSGLELQDNRMWSQNSWGVDELCERFDLFGQSLATGDFDFDGRMDLSIGVPGETNGTGAAHALMGSSDGLAISNNNDWFLYW